MKRNMKTPWLIYQLLTLLAWRLCQSSRFIRATVIQGGPFHVTVAIEESILSIHYTNREDPYELRGSFTLHDVVGYERGKEWKNCLASCFNLVILHLWNNSFLFNHICQYMTYLPSYHFCMKTGGGNRGRNW